MDKRTGRLYIKEQLAQFSKKDVAKHFTTIIPTQAQLGRLRVGRNDDCPCKSGKKFKHCCYGGGR